MKQEPESGEGLFAIIVMLVLLGPLLIWYAWVIKTVWNWWLPATVGLPALTLRGALGIALVKSLLFGRRDTDTDEGPLEQAGRVIGRAVFSPAFTLLIAWIAYLIAF